MIEERFWNGFETKLLRSGVAAGMTNTELARLLNRTPNAVVGKIARLKLKSKARQKRYPAHFKKVDRAKLAKNRAKPQRRVRDQKPQPAPGEEKVRACLMCSGDFISTFDGERVCKRCKSTREWRSGQHETYSMGGAP